MNDLFLYSIEWNNVKLHCLFYLRLSNIILIVHFFIGLFEMNLKIIEQHIKLIDL